MKKSLHTKSDTVVVILCTIVVISIVSAVGHYQRELAFRTLCASNLSALGKPMLLYANDYNDELPKAGFLTNQWVDVIPNWLATTRQAAFGMNHQHSEGQTTVTSSLYLLVKFADVDPKTFVCRSDFGTKAFELDDTQGPIPSDIELHDVWDFGNWDDADNNPSKRCSYAYHIPFGRYALTTSHEPGMAVLADRNPWMDPNRANDPYAGWDHYIPDHIGSDDPDKVLLGNSDSHHWDGQNVLFLDTHVSFNTRATCGVEEDNIYTYASSEEQGHLKGTLPKVYRYNDHTTSRKDSVLVQEHGRMRDDVDYGRGHR